MYIKGGVEDRKKKVNIIRQHYEIVAESFSNFSHFEKFVMMEVVCRIKVASNY